MGCVRIWADFSDQFRKIIIRYKRIEYISMQCDSLNV